MVKDVKPGPEGSINSIVRFAGAGGRLYFAADDGKHGIELWRSDGTGAGTSLVRDIYPGPGDSSPRSLVDFGGTLMFAASDGPVHGRELWRSDGTEGGTTLVADIRPGPFYSNPEALTAVGRTLFLRADDGTHGMEPWRSDGTTAGTALVKDINPGPRDSFPDDFTGIGGLALFGANLVDHGRRLWASTGRSRGTEMVQARRGTPPFGPNALTDVNGTLFFRAFNGGEATDIYKATAHGVTRRAAAKKCDRGGR
jgi:ELWxxDGT repeat protein